MKLSMSVDMNLLNYTTLTSFKELKDDQNMRLLILLNDIY